MNGNNEEMLDGQAQTQVDPNDLGAAFESYQHFKRENSQTDLSSEDESGTGAEVDNVSTDVSTTDNDGDLGGSSSSDSIADEGDDDGLPDEIDFAAITSSIDRQLAENAIANTKQYFSENNIRHWDISDLVEYEKDYDGNPTGNILFKDPDHKGKYISRSEARAWCNDTNSDIDKKFREIASAEMRKLKQQNGPKYDLINFCETTYKSLDKNEIETLNILIEPYAIVANNQIIGYRCDLNQAAATARNIVARNKQQYKREQPRVEVPVSQPSLDMPSSASSSSTTPVDPNDLGAAMAAYQAQRRANKKR